MRLAAAVCLMVCSWGGMATAEEAPKGYTDTDVKAAKKLYEKGVYLLDVRTEPEYEAGHLPGAQLIPVQELAKRLDEVKAKKKAQILVYCRSGARSAVASDLLEKQGYTNVTNMLGGFMAWSRADYPSEKGKSKPPVCCAEEATEDKASAPSDDGEAPAS